MKNTSILIPLILIACLTVLGYLLYQALQTVEDDRLNGNNRIVLNQADYEEAPAPDDAGATTDYPAAERRDDDEAAISAAAGRTGGQYTGDGGFRELTAAEREEARRQARLEEEAEAAEEEARRVATDGRTADAPVTSRPAVSTATNATKGLYLVIAGSFRQQANAQSRATALRNAGFVNTTVEKFNRGTYAVALAGQSNRFTTAERLAERIRNAGFEARVMRRR